VTRIGRQQKDVIFERASGCCEYCMSQSRFSVQPFSIEHIFPRGLGGKSVLENLALSCQGCNGHKAIKTVANDPVTGELVSLYHPRQQIWTDHFAWKNEYSIVIGLTPTGRATVEALQLNREGVVNLRQVLHAIGQHPPQLPSPSPIQGSIGQI